jgi:hypothetical protein
MLPEKDTTRVLSSKGRTSKVGVCREATRSLVFNACEAQLSRRDYPTEGQLNSSSLSLVASMAKVASRSSQRRRYLLDRYRTFQQHQRRRFQPENVSRASWRWKNRLTDGDGGKCRFHIFSTGRWCIGRDLILIAKTTVSSSYGTFSNNAKRSILLKTTSVVLMVAGTSYLKPVKSYGRCLSSHLARGGTVNWCYVITVLVPSCFLFPIHPRRSNFNIFPVSSSSQHYQTRGLSASSGQGV